MFTLDTAPPHPSLSAPVPKGWTAERYGDAQEYKRAIDPDGCRWYYTDGQWKLNVPGFRRSPGLSADRSDDIANVDHKDGRQPFPITEGGTIKIGNRCISPSRWSH